MYRNNVPFSSSEEQSEELTRLNPAGVESETSFRPEILQENEELLREDYLSGPSSAAPTRHQGRRDGHSFKLLERLQPWQVFLAGTLFGLFIAILADLDGIIAARFPPSQLCDCNLELLCGVPSVGTTGFTHVAASRKEAESEGTCDSWVHKWEGESGEDPWHFVKASIRPAACTVNGIVVEELDAENNFRRAFALAFTNDVESKETVFPFLRAFQDLSLGRAKRRVYLDLGGNFFKTSVTWFLQNYPLDFTEIHVFEVTSKFMIPDFPTPAQEARIVTKKLNHMSRWRMGRSGPPPFPAWVLKRIKQYRNFVSTVDDKKKGLIDITRFIKKTLNISPQDTLIVKMDIEEEEWNVLPVWLKDPDMVNLVDELFVEIHYFEDSMSAYNWDKHKHSRQEAVNLFTSLRKAGFVAHPWP